MTSQVYENLSNEISANIKQLPPSTELQKRLFVLSMGKDLSALEKFNQELLNRIKKRK